MGWKSACLGMLLAFLASCADTTTSSLQSVQDGRNVLGMHVNADGSYEFKLCPMSKEFTQQFLAEECINPLLSHDGLPTTFASLPDSPKTLKAHLQNTSILVASSLIAAGITFWVGRYFVNLKGTKFLGIDIMLRSLDEALTASRKISDDVLPPSLEKRLLNEQGLLKKEIRIAIQYDPKLNKLKLTDGKVIEGKKAINKHLVEELGVTKEDLLRDLSNLHELLDSGKFLTDKMENGLKELVSSKDLSKEVIEDLTKADLLIEEIDNTLHFSDEMVAKIRSYQDLSPEELEQVTHIKKVLNLQKTPEETALMDLTIKQAEEKIQTLKASLKYTKDKSGKIQLDKTSKIQINKEIKSLQAEIKKSKYDNKSGFGEVTFEDKDIARNAILNSQEVGTAGKEGFLQKVSHSLRNTFRYKNADGKFTTHVRRHDEVVESLTTERDLVGKIAIESGVAKISSQMAGGGVFVSLLTIWRNKLPGQALLNANSRWQELTSVGLSAEGKEIDDILSIIKGIASATNSKVSDGVFYFLLNTGTR